MKKATFDDLAEPYKMYVEQLEKVAEAAKTLTQLVDEREAVAVKHVLKQTSKSQYLLHGRVLEPRIKKARTELRRELKKLEDGLEEPDCKDPTVVVDLLSLAGVTVEKETVEQWSDEQRREAARWAVTLHLKASNHEDVEVLPRPEFLDGT